MDDLWRALRADAAAHEPDRELILARIEAREPARARMRPLLAAAAAAAVLVATTLVGWSLRAQEDARPVVTPSDALGRTTSEVPPPPVGESAPAARPFDVVASPDSSGNGYWAQADVRVTVRRTVTALTVTIRIRAAAGETFAGAFSTASTVVATSASEGGFLVYRWTLGDGDTLTPGTYLFAAQFAREPGPRSSSHDTYAVDDTTGNF
ncbi:hypothetical protein EDD29_4381 [Actinocorallia herbida]|uniref:Uncharacterized protein n=1 Tax=Actinocorallia herbida TaxID=58109 RepID=A0A3N1CZU7_9ACTN|nr:hypothetical protein [Actinocorallia herbida]ROO86800.1 hypothetical protein EDD29_4381 [Actinocorallia herbida]